MAILSCKIKVKKMLLTRTVLVNKFLLTRTELCTANNSLFTCIQFCPFWVQTKGYFEGVSDFFETLGLY